MGRNKKVTIYDLAKALDISVGTVNRALHDKARISKETKQRVLDMADKMNFKISHTAQSLRRNPIRIGCILCCPVPQYLNEVKRGMEAAFSGLVEYNVVADLHIFEGDNSDKYYHQIQEIMYVYQAEKYNGIILFLSGNNSMFCPMITKMKASGIETATVANDIWGSERIISVTADGRCAGSLAAELLHLCCPGRNIAILTGSKETEIHKENIEGFLSFAKQNSFKSIEIYEHDDQPDKVIEKVSQIVKEGNDFSGIYITSASSYLACREIEKQGLAGKMKIITTDLFDETRQLLQQGIACATIFQNPFKQGKDVVKKMYRYLYDKNGEGQFYITPQAIFSSNMNLYK